MKMIYSKGFTLIELLVVISIIGVLSSVVLASMGSVRQKAKLGAAKTFATYNYHAFGASAVAYYDFNDFVDAIGPVTDQSGNGNNGTIIANSLCSFNKCLIDAESFGGDNGKSLKLNNGCCISVQANPSIKTLNSQTINHEGSISVWYKSGTENILAGLDLLFARYNILIFGISDTGFYINDYSGTRSSNPVTTYVPSNISKSARDGKWHNLVLTFKSGIDAGSQIYVDGNAVGSKFKIVYNTNDSDGVYIGGSPYQVNTGSIDDFAIYSKSLLASEVQQLYAMGRESHLIAEK